MTDPETTWIETIVREVLRQLAPREAAARGTSDGATAGGACACGGRGNALRSHVMSSASSSEAADLAADSVWTLSAAVVSLDALAQVPPSCRHVRIGPRAVITPAARDAMRERGITWERVGGKETVAACAPERGERTVLVAIGASAAGAARSVATADEVIACEDLEEGARRIAPLVRRSGLRIVVLTDAPEELVWRASRFPDVRPQTICACGRPTRPTRANVWVFDDPRALQEWCPCASHKSSAR